MRTVVPGPRLASLGPPPKEPPIYEHLLGENSLARVLPCLQAL